MEEIIVRKSWKRPWREVGICDGEDEENRADQAWAEEAENNDGVGWGRSACSSEMERMVGMS